MVKERRRKGKLKGGEAEGEMDEREGTRASVTEKWVYINPDLAL